MYRVFKGFRSLLASPAASSSSLLSAMSAAKFSSTSAVAKSATSKVAKKAPKKRNTSKPKAAEKTASPRIYTRPTGILKVAPVSPALGHFLGAQQASRTEAVKQIWSYIKSQNLQNPENKKEVFCDEKLKTIFDGKEKVGFLEIGKLLSRHFVKTN